MGDEKAGHLSRGLSPPGQATGLHWTDKCTTRPPRAPPGFHRGGGPARRAAAYPAQRALKYFASGWWMTMASVDCSGWSWNSSESWTPMRSGSSSSAILARSSRSGQAP